MITAGIITRRDGWVEAIRAQRLQQCMGGWCRKRQACAHHHAPTHPDMPPVERLCAKGIDEPVRTAA